jgi:hypothetical protein
MGGAWFDQNWISRSQRSSIPSQHKRRRVLAVLLLAENAKRAGHATKLGFRSQAVNPPGEWALCAGASML